MRLITFITFIIFISPLLIKAQTHSSVSKKATPKWVDVNDFSDSENIVEGQEEDHYYLLVDEQVNTGLEEFYSRIVVKLYNEVGVQDFSDFEIKSDPEYEKLFFHHIDIYRDGKKIEKLPYQNIQSFQRESSLEYKIYDGSITSFINLNDVRPGDIIDYSYTKKGSNPIYKGLFNYYFDFQYSTPVQNIYARLLIPKSENVELKYSHDGYDAVKSLYGEHKEYLWDIHDVKPLYEEANTPNWYSPYARVQISNSNKWLNLISWSVDLFELGEDEKQSVKGFVKGFDENTKNLKAASIISFVQNEIRYFGLEGGLSSHKPHPPSQIIEQRFGDCKDKSLLLSAALSEIGIEAYPMLVHSSKGYSLDDYLPAPTIFNHCVVAYKLDGNYHFVDPTISGQGGRIDDTYFPNYGKGLIVSDKSEFLIDLPVDSTGFAEINENFTSQGIEKPILLEVYSHYYGRRADGIRSFFRDNSIDKVTQDYLKYYANSYPQIKTTDKISIKDSYESGVNEFEVWESYEVSDQWTQYEDDSGMFYLETYPNVFRDEINLTKTPQRNMPYNLSFPKRIIQNTRITFHDEWNVTENNDNVFGVGFEYEKTTDYVESTRTVLIRQEFKHTKPFIEAKEYDDYRKEVEDIADHAGFVASFNTNVVPAAERELSFIAILASVLLILLMAYLLYSFYSSYDPEPQLLVYEPRTIGGWLILPAIGILLSPIYILVGIFTAPDFWYLDFWRNYLDSSHELYNIPLMIIVVFESVINTCFFVFTVFAAYLFYKKRVAAISVMIAFYIVNVSVQVLDIAMVTVFTPDSLSVTDRNSIIKSAIQGIIGMAIWVPYFLSSVRVKETFVYRLNGSFHKSTETLDTDSDEKLE